MELILQSMTILTLFINLEGLWLFGSLKGVFFDQKKDIIEDTIL